MASSKKKRGLVPCSNCDCTLSPKHLEKHNDVCSRDRPLSACLPTTLSVKSFHQFIVDRYALFGLAEGVKGVKDLDVHASAGWAKRNTVLLHSLVMDNMGLQPKAPCVLLRNNQRATAIVWPSDAVGEMRVGLLNEGKVAETLVILQPIDPMSVSSAKEVVLKSIGQWKRFFETDEFLLFLNAYFVGAFLDVGAVIDVQYFGQRCEFVVDHFNVSGKILRNKIDEDVNHLADSVYDLSLDAESLNTTAVFSTPPSTPVSTGNKSRLRTAPATADLFIPAIPSLPAAIVECGQQTKFSLIANGDTKSYEMAPTKTFADVGGLSLAKHDLRAQLIKPLMRDDSVAGLPVLISGPTGCGKSLLLEAIVGELKAANLHIVRLAASELLSRVFSESEKSMQKLRDLVESESGRKSVLLLNDLDVLIAGGKDSETTLKIANLLCSFLDSSMNLTVLATVRSADRLDDALRRRFILEIELPVPSAEERAEILNLIVQQLNLKPSDELTLAVSDIAQTTHGFTGADLAAVCRLAATQCDEHSDIAGHLRVAAKRIRPTALREIILEVPKVHWSDVGGQDQLKLQLQQVVEWPRLHPESFKRLGVPPPSGILLYGPPGCSKTLIARALATESGLNFLAVKGPELFSKWVGESERAVRELFRRARQVSPAIVFFDEIDALAVTRASQKEGGGSGVGDRVLAQLLTELDGLESLSGVTVVAATNRPDVIDRALLRPGRLDRTIYVPLPDQATRAAIVRLQLERIPAAEDVSVDAIVAKTVGYSGAEVVAVCRNAAMTAMRRDVNICTVPMLDFNDAINSVKPRSDPTMLAMYDSFSRAIVE